VIPWPRICCEHSDSQIGVHSETMAEQRDYGKHKS
jgi:hypothetical protein